METSDKPIFIIGGVLLMAVIIVLAAVLVWQGSGKKTLPSDIESSPMQADSFIFFGLGANGTFTRAGRELLKQRLGAEAVSQMVPIDLTIIDKSFTRRHFPAVDILNQALNDAAGARVEHNATKFMYRYARRKGGPFKDVELIFSNYSGRALIFRIIAGPAGAGVVDTMRKKYGTPTDIKNVGREAHMIYWQKHGDLLVVSIGRDRFGKAQFKITFLFKANIEDLIKVRQQERNKQEVEKIRRATNAF